MDSILTVLNGMCVYGQHWLGSPQVLSRLPSLTATEMKKGERPQDVKKKWALEKTVGKPQGRFLAYRLKTQPPNK